ncbi:MAG: thermonuclease family protein, partial [Polaromonas sp.]|nr:thermonuclease family protein [Polaromonas sp.]
ILGIDANEICHTGGQPSRAAMAVRVRGRPVALTTPRIDDYGRVIATVYLAGDDVAGWMVTNGQAWSYRFRRDGGPYLQQQALAKAAKRGLFAAPDALEPRLFRQRHGLCKS